MNKEIIYKYLSGEASMNEKIAVMHWINESEEHRRELMAMRRLYDIEIWNPDLKKAPAAASSRLVSLRRHARELLRIAAVLLLAVACFHLFGSDGPTAWQTVSTPAGQRAELLLADGSRVWLNACSRVKFPTSFMGGTRDVEIDGEAYFKVAKDSAKPFIVKTGNYRIQVTGTEFNVKSYADRQFFETALVEGSVTVQSLKTHQKIKLQPNMKVYSFGKDMYLSAASADNRYLWREGIICFDDEPLAEIFDKIGQCFDVKILNRNRRISHLRFSGKFRMKDGVEHLLRTLQLSSGFDYLYSEDENTIIIR